MEASCHSERQSQGPRDLSRGRGPASLAQQNVAAARLIGQPMSRSRNTLQQHTTCTVWRLRPRRAHRAHVLSVLSMRPILTPKVAKVLGNRPNSIQLMQHRCGCALSRFAAAEGRAAAVAIGDGPAVCSPHPAGQRAPPALDLQAHTNAMIGGHIAVKGLYACLTIPGGHPHEPYALLRL